MPNEISPEQQIANVISSLQAIAARKPYAGQVDTLRATTDQLAEMWAQYQAGELKPIWDDGTAF